MTKKDKNNKGIFIEFEVVKAFKNDLHKSALWTQYMYLAKRHSDQGFFCGTYKYFHEKIGISRGKLQKAEAEWIALGWLKIETKPFNMVNQKHHYIDILEAQKWMNKLIYGDDFDEKTVENTPNSDQFEPILDESNEGGSYHFSIGGISKNDRSPIENQHESYQKTIGGISKNDSSIIKTVLNNDQTGNKKVKNKNAREDASEKNILLSSDSVDNRYHVDGHGTPDETDLLIEYFVNAVFDLHGIQIDLPHITSDGFRKNWDKPAVKICDIEPDENERKKLVFESIKIAHRNGKKMYSMWAIFDTFKELKKQADTPHEIHQMVSKINDFVCDDHVKKNEVMEIAKHLVEKGVQPQQFEETIIPFWKSTWIYKNTKESGGDPTIVYTKSLNAQIQVYIRWLKNPRTKIKASAVY